MRVCTKDEYQIFLTQSICYSPSCPSPTQPEIVQGMGYPAEVHHVTTSDGYLLELHRIPHGAAGPSESRLPVLLQHGILGSSADWVLNTADQALGGWCERTSEVHSAAGIQEGDTGGNIGSSFRRAVTKEIKLENSK
uniref:Partial AB-hydrolase lipase domain-containing protein n=1 Tax=Scylla olivacea TaxID=85551 RepID=A0A0P4WEQ7_SCYOL